MEDRRQEILNADYWDAWDRFAVVMAHAYTADELDELRAMIRSRGLRKLHRVWGEAGDRFGAVWRQAITLGEEADLDVVATHLTDPARPSDASA